MEELISPCEVLVHMTSDGQLGFGHLRYQEHLVAKYLREHRNVDLVAHANDTWWFEVIVLLSKMLPDMEWLIGLLVIDSYNTAKKLIDTIITLQKPEKRRRLREIVNAHRKLGFFDKRDSSFLDM